MAVFKVSLGEVMGDDPNTPFWQHIANHPDYPKFEQDIDYIMAQSRKHGVPFTSIDPSKLDSYKWKLK